MKIIINDDFKTQTSSLYLRSEDSRGHTYYSKEDMVDGVIGTLVKHEDGFAVQVHPLLTMPMHLMRAFMHAMQEHLSQSGKTTENENLIIGKLKATELHLADSRENLAKVLNAFIDLTNQKP